MNLTFFIWIFAFGAAIGSFLNVCIYRIPENLSLVKPGSFCPSCKKPLKFYHNIPLLSYLFLRGRCAYCGKSISIRYFLIELFSALLTILLVWKFGISADAVFYLSLVYGLIVIAVIDWQTNLILNKVLILLLLVGIVVNSWSHSIGWQNAIIGFFVGGGILFLLAFAGERLFKKESMGMGDVKFAAVLGFFLGWKSALLALYFGFFIAAVLYIFIKLIRNTPIEKYIPMGPFFALSTMIWILWGQNLIQWYLNWIR